MCVPCQTQQLYDNYGKNDSRKVAKVKLLYSDLGLPSVYSAYEEKSHDEIQRLIQEVSTCNYKCYINYCMTASYSLLTASAFFVSLFSMTLLISYTCLYVYRLKTYQRMST